MSSESATEPAPRMDMTSAEEFRRRIRRAHALLGLLAVVTMVAAAVFFEDADEPVLLVIGVGAVLVGSAVLLSPAERGRAGSRWSWLAFTASTLGVFVAAHALDPPGEGAFVALFMLSGLGAATLTLPLTLVTAAIGAAATLVVNGMAASPLLDTIWQPAAIFVVCLIAYLLTGDLLQRIDLILGIERAAAERAEAVSLVADAARRVATLDPDALLAELVRTALLLGFDSGNASLISADRSTYEVVQPMGFDVDYGGRQYSADVGMIGLVMEAGGTVIIDDYATHPQALPVLAAQGYRVTVGTPIRVEGEVIGVLVVGRRSSMPVSPATQEALELLAAMSGRALHNARLFSSEQRAVERLERLDALKSDFVSNVSHELRTPLTLINGIALTLHGRGDLLDEGVHADLMDRLVRNTSRLTDIVTRLLDFTRLESGAVRVVEEDLDLFAVLELVVSAVQGPSPHHDLRLETDGSLFVRADGLLVERIVENLVTNAVKHTPAGTRVVVTARHLAGGVEVAVADNGPGIPSEDLNHLFDRFFRGGEPNTRETGGLGLGLAFASELVRLHGSELTVVSAPGQGTVFRFGLAAAPGGV